MIKVLNKTFAILEEIVIASPAPVSLNTLSEKLDINKATCSRIIGDLVAAGYLEQVSRLEGYTAGARAHAFSEMLSYKDTLVSEARPIIKSCAEAIKESVLLAELSGLERYILCHYNYNESLNINIDKLSFNDLYDTATGVMLLAYADKTTVDAVVKRNGLPDCEILPDIDSREKLNECLNKIRNVKEFVYDGPRWNNLSIVAFPVFENKKFVASVGASVPGRSFCGEHKAKVIEKVKNAAGKISLAISHIGSIG
jgi:DNA-binding IclR family transcriptional regulator